MSSKLAFWIHFQGIWHWRNGYHRLVINYNSRYIKNFKGKKKNSLIFRHMNIIIWIFQANRNENEFLKVLNSFALLFRKNIKCWKSLKSLILFNFLKFIYLDKVWLKTNWLYTVFHKILWQKKNYKRKVV